jgi:uncharacterized membrane protein YciS (DUF1049 family)
MNKSQKMTKGTKIYYSIGLIIIMGLMAYNWHQGGLIAIISSVVSIIVATAIVFAIEWLRVCIDIMDTDKQIKAEIAEIETKITELKVPDGIGEDSEVTLDGGMVYFINVPENEKYKVVIMAFIDTPKKPQKTIKKQKRNKVKRNKVKRRIANASRRKNRS